MKAVQLVTHGEPGNSNSAMCRTEPRADESSSRSELRLNHLDLWLEEAGLPMPVQLPRTPGGEIRGRILEVGSDVKDWKPSDDVAVQSNLFCGECEFCKRGESPSVFGA
jgi:D-arabinose 1-dehydrogenase-like Zn-dependent alcohol dehydrogenase